jgi:hypothetical protein
MARYVRERFEAGRPVPPETQPPANGSPLFRALVRRQVESLDWLRTPIAFWWGGALGPDRAARRTRQDAWPRIHSAIDGGRLAMVGLIRHQGFNPFRLTESHQVLGYGYDVTWEAVTLRVYDPNHPDDDGVTIVIGAENITQSTGEPLVGLLALERGANGLEIRPWEAPGRRSGPPRTGRPARRRDR